MKSFAARCLVAGSILAGIALVVFLIGVASQAFLLVFLGLLISIVFCAAAKALEKRSRLSYNWSLAIVLVLLAILAAACAWFLGNRIADQVQQLATTLPAAFHQAQGKLNRYPWAQKLFSELSNSGSSGASSFIHRITGFFSGFLSVVTALIFILFVAMYLASDPRLYRTGLLSLIPRSSRPRAEDVISSVHDVLERWLLGKLALMSVVGVLTAIGLWALNMPLIFTLALLAALLDFIPNFGPVISAIPAVLLALVRDPYLAIWVMVLYTAVQILESYVLAPVVQRRAVSLGPALLLTSQIVFGILLGGLGLIVATPLTAAIVVLIRKLYCEQILGDEPQGA